MSCVISAYLKKNNYLKLSRGKVSRFSNTFNLKLCKLLQNSLKIEQINLHHGLVEAKVNHPILTIQRNSK